METDVVVGANLDSIDLVSRRRTHIRIPPLLNCHRRLRSVTGVNDGIVWEREEFLMDGISKFVEAAVGEIGSADAPPK